MPTLPIVLEVIGARNVQSALKGVQSDVKKAGAGLNSAAKSGDGFALMGNRAAAAFDSSTRSATKFNKTAALAGSVASYGLANFTNAAIAAGDEAQSSSLKLDALLEKRDPGARRGLDELADKMAHLTGFDDDIFVEASARLVSFGVKGSEISEIMDGMAGQSETMGDGMAGVLANAEQVGKALNSINAGALTRGGTTLDPKDVAAINDLKKAGDFAGARALLFEKIKESYAKYAVGAGSSMSEAQKARGRFQTKSGDIQEALGQGAGAARGAWQGAASGALGALNKDQLKVAGAGLEVATMTAPLLTFMATVGQSVPAWQILANTAGKLKDAGPLAARGIAWTTSTLRAHTFATTFNANANIAAAGKIRIAGLTAGTALGAAGVALGALAAIAYGLNETIAGIRNAQTLSDEDLEAKGPMGKFHSRAGHAMSWMFGGEKQSDADKQSAAIFAKMGKKKRSLLPSDDNIKKYAVPGAGKPTAGSYADTGSPDFSGGIEGQIQQIKRNQLLRKIERAKNADRREAAEEALAIFDLNLQKKDEAAVAASRKRSNAAIQKALARQQRAAERKAAQEESYLRQEAGQRISDQKADALAAVADWKRNRLAALPKGRGVDNSFMRGSIENQARVEARRIQQQATAAKRQSRGYQATVKVNIPETRTDRAARAYR